MTVDREKAILRFAKQTFTPMLGAIFLIFAILAVIFTFPLFIESAQTVKPTQVQKPVGYDYDYGQDVPPDVLAQAVSLSAGQSLLLRDTYNLFFSNVPEMPTETGILFSVGDVLSPSGMVRVFLSHMNLLIDWSAFPGNLPASAGFSVENNTSRMLDIYAVRGAMAVSCAPDGTYLFEEDAAPVKPGDDGPLYYGSAIGNYIVREWFISESRQPVCLGSVAPGGRIIVSEDVGPRGWVCGIYDLKFVDAVTGRQVGKGELEEGEMVAIKSFLAPCGANLDSFLDQPKNQLEVLPPGVNDLLHMRGLFVPGYYQDNSQGEAVSKQYTINYSAGSGKIASFALAAGENDQGVDHYALGYVPDVFLNDRVRNGYDPYSEGVNGVDGGNYGVDYQVDLKLSGPVALVIQEAIFSERHAVENFIDLHNQILTTWLDGKVITIQQRDPSYAKFYYDFSSLRPMGYGRVIATFRENGTHDHVLRFTLPPNGYGPVRFYLLPLK